MSFEGNSVNDLPATPVDSNTDSTSSYRYRNEDIDFIFGLQPLGIKRYPYYTRTPRYIIENDPNHLTSMEKDEILGYPSVYYYGEHSPFKDSNYENNGTYRPIVYDHLYYRYEMGYPLGSGGYGVVVEAYDHKNNELVAIKIFRKFTEYTPYREVVIINSLKQTNDPISTKNLVQMKNYFWFRGYLFIVFEKLSINCYELLKTCETKLPRIGIDLIKNIAYMIIESLFFLNKHKIVHCDIKPDNILLNNGQNGSLFKLCDFGLSCFYSEIDNRYIIQTLNYSAPEILYAGRVTPAVDMWSVGCLIAELYSGKTLFRGINSHTQLIAIMEVVGVPPIQLLRRLPDSALYFMNVNGVPKYCTFVEDGFGGMKIIPKVDVYGLPGSKSLKKAIGVDLNEYDDMIDFIGRCLKWDYESRLTPAAAMHHPFLKKRVPRTPLLDKEFPKFALPAILTRRHTEIISEGRRENDKHFLTNAF